MVTKKKTNKRKFSSRHIIKRHGHKETFDARKVYGTVYEACMSAHVKEKQAEKIAIDVSDFIAKMVKKKRKHYRARNILRSHETPKKTPRGRGIHV